MITMIKAGRFVATEWKTIGEVAKWAEEHKYVFLMLDGKYLLVYNHKDDETIVYLGVPFFIDSVTLKV